MNNKSGDDLFATGGGLDLARELQSDHDADFIGRPLGGYTVTGLIARGGMSRVYRAERSDGSFEREVAIKVSAGAAMNDEMRRRFAIEQGVLAGLNHPNIAQLFDVDVTDEGWPYIVMELINGESIDQYVEHQQQPLAQRVQLLLDVADAIEYAHARLVVHRDLKPSNVMVDSTGRPKLLDFGIAKLLEQDATELTQAGAMTPRYASPEQLLRKPVTVASDVYQFGLLAFEILTDKPINAHETITEAIERAAKEQPLVLDSTAAQSLPRELRLVIEQCLRVATDERYANVAALKADLQAWLSGYPVTAVGQGSGYRLRKFISRNRMATGLSALLLATIAIGVTTYTLSVGAARDAAEAERDEADRQRTIATESLRFLESMLNNADPNISQRGDITIREAVDASIERVGERYTGRPEVQARVYATVARVYESLGDFARAEELAHLAQAATVEGYGHGSPEYFAARNQVVGAQVKQGDYERAKQAYETIIAEMQETLGADAHQTIRAMSGLAFTHYYLGNVDQFAEINEQVLAYSAEALGETHMLTLDTVYNVAITRINNGRYEETIQLVEPYLAAAEERFGPGHATTLHLLTILGNAYGYSGDLEEELRIRERHMERVTQSFGDHHLEVAVSLINMSAVLSDLERHEEVEPLLARALEIRASVFGEDHPETLSTRVNLAVHRARYGLKESAFEELEDTIALQSELFGPDHHATVAARMYKAEVMLLNDMRGAAQVVAEDIALAKRVLGENHPELARVIESIDSIIAERGDG